MPQHLNPSRRLVPPVVTTLLALLATALPVMLAGCGFGAASAPSVEIGASTLSGRVRGGQQAVTGATINLYAAGTSGNGTGAVDLLAPNVVLTDGAGGFSITNEFHCPSANTQVYLVARGGNPGLSGNQVNPALIEVAALGSCGSLSASSFVTIDEVTTVAAVWALAPFLGPNAIAGASATNGTGLANAFKAAANLANVASGFAPGAALPAGATMELAKLNTFANSLSSCVNSNGGLPCQPLFTAARAGGSTPANTVDAALNIVRNPGSNVSAVFVAGPAQGPFQPSLAAAPHDWTMSLTFSGGGLNQPGAVAIDAAGGVWTPNFFGQQVSHFLPDGSSSAVPGAGLRNSYGLTIAADGSIWVANEQSVPAAGNSQFGSVSRFVNGVEVSGYGYTTGGVYYPQSIAADANGTVWVANYGSSSASLFAASGTALSPASGLATSALPFTTAVALDAAHNAWFAVQGSAVKVAPSGGFSTYPCCSSPSGIAVDQAANVWVADYGSDSVVKLSPAGNVAATVVLAGGLNAPASLAIDGAGNVWTANYYGNSVAELAGSSAALLSPPLGFGQDAPFNEPYGIAIDASGNLWLSNAGGKTLTELVGLAAPIATPLLGPPAQP